MTLSCLDQLHLAVSAVAAPPSDEWQRLCATVRSKSLSRGEHFLKAGQRATSIAFVCSGLMRMYYATEDGKEFIRGFAPEGSFSTDYASLTQRRPAMFSIEALEDSELLLLPAKAFESGFWQGFRYRIAEKLFLIKERREASLLLNSPRARYEEFRRNHPGLMRRVSDRHIAYYLGITPVHLSRIKNRKS